MRRLPGGVRPALPSCWSPAGTFKRLYDARRPNSYLALSDPGDVARVEDRTFICSERRDRRRPDQQLARPGRDEGRADRPLHGRHAGPHDVRRAVLAWARSGSPIAHIGVQLTDSRLRRREHADHDPHGPGRPRRARRRRRVRPLPALGRLPAGRRRRPAADVPWPCDAENKYIVHFPETREIWSYGSGYGGNALLGKKCFALRIASTMARDDGWMAEHMLILGVTSPERREALRRRRRSRRPAARPTWPCSSRPCPGWKVETVGDDIAWMKFGDDGRLYAINPEAGFFGVAPGTSDKTNPNALATLDAQLHLHQRGPHRRRRRLVGGPHRRPAGPPHRLEGPGLDARVGDARPPTPTPGSPRRPPQCPSIAPEWEDPAGVPISAILFGGRRATNVPLVTEAFDWQHGVFLGSIMSSEKTAAAGRHRRRSCASTPSPCCRSAATTWATTSPTGSRSARPPTPRSCPSCSGSTGSARATTARSCGPASARTAGCSSGSSSGSTASGDAVDTPIGRVPTADALDTTGLDIDAAAWPTLLDGRPRGWRAEVPQIEAHYESIGERLPAVLRDELKELEKRLADEAASPGPVRQLGAAGHGEGTGPGHGGSRGVLGPVGQRPRPSRWPCPGCPCRWPAARRSGRRSARPRSGPRPTRRRRSRRRPNRAPGPASG